MKVITIDSQVYKELLKKLDFIIDYVMEKKELQNTREEDEAWVDSYEVCTHLRISERTLQRLRASGDIAYSVITGKNYYTIGEIKRVLKAKLIRTDDDNLKELILQHQTYQELRKKNKPKK